MRSSNHDAHSYSVWHIYILYAPTLCPHTNGHVRPLCALQLLSDHIQQREHEGRILSLLEDRTDEACHWITEVPAFQDWLTGQGPQSLALLGPLGFGKTFTIPYVVDYLKSGHDAFASNTPTAGTCSITAARVVHHSRIKTCTSITAKPMAPPTNHSMYSAVCFHSCSNNTTIYASTSIHERENRRKMDTILLLAPYA